MRYRTRFLNGYWRVWDWLECRPVGQVCYSQSRAQKQANRLNNGQFMQGAGRYIKALRLSQKG